MEKLWNAEYVKVLVGNFLIHFSFTLIVPLLPLYLSETFGATKDMTGLVLAGYTVVSLLTRPFSGYLLDSYPRKTVLLICNILFSFVFLGYLAAGSLAVFAIFRTIHGGPYGSATVATSTAAIDVLPSSRRSEGIGYFGLSNNLAMALGPVCAVYVLQACSGNFNVLFSMSLAISLVGLVVDAFVKFPKKDYSTVSHKVMSLDRFFLLKGLTQALSVVCFSCSFGVLSTYVVIYGRDELGITSGTGAFFTLFAAGLIISRLTGAKSLARNRISRNAAMGIVVSMIGYAVFAGIHAKFAFFASAFIIGLGNGHMYPAMQSMFINLADHNQRGTANSSIMTSWDAGVGLGILIGGALAEFIGYHAAFWFALAINVTGAIWFFLKARPHFEANKLR